MRADSPAPTQHATLGLEHLHGKHRREFSQAERKPNRSEWALPGAAAQKTSDAFPLLVVWGYKKHSCYSEPHRPKR